MWKTIGHWTLGVAGAVLLTVPAVGARADETQQAQDRASQAGQQMKNAGQDVGNAAESTGHAAGNAAEGAWSSTKGAANTAGNKAEQTTNTPPISDDWITTQVKQKLTAQQPNVTDVDVHTKKDVVTLTGNVDSEATRSQVVDLARHVDGVKQVKDHIQVNPKQ